MEMFSELHLHSVSIRKMRVSQKQKNILLTVVLAGYFVHQNSNISDCVYADFFADVMDHAMSKI